MTVREDKSNKVLTNTAIWNRLPLVLNRLDVAQLGRALH